MAKISRASAPGKILLIGGYSVLIKGNASLVLAIDRRVRAESEKLAGNRIAIEMPQFSVSISGRFEPALGKIAFEKALSEDESKYSKFAVACAESCLAYLGRKGAGAEELGVRVKAVNDEGFTFRGGSLKSGFGSSAAATTAMTASVLGLFGKGDIGTIHRLAQYAHAAAQGKVGSGFDVAAAAYGSIRYARYSPELASGRLPEVIDREWDYSAERAALPKGWLLAVGFTGESASTTEMVKRVNSFRDANRVEYEGLMGKVNEENVAAIEALRRIGELAESDSAAYIAAIEAPERNGLFAEFKSHFAEGRRLLKKLGERSGAPIETDAHTALIELAERSGAFVARLPGAGGGDSLVAVCLSEEGRKGVREAWEGKGIFIIDVEPSERGVLLE